MKPPFGNKIKAIGVMSGTSMDGLDLVAVEFQLSEHWSYKIIETDTIPYSDTWFEKLTNAPTFSGEKLAETDVEYGKLIGNEVSNFIERSGFKPDLICSHGHTIFHQPEKYFTLQIGNGADIAALTQCTTIANFRITDVALGGQGAPLVPVGDKLLFSEFQYCLNLGGFANVSFEYNNQRIAYDIGPANFPINHFAAKKGLPFDKDGILGKKGEVNHALLGELNNLDFYKQDAPKSLGREWMENKFYPVLNKYNISDTDKLRTIYEHIALQISKISAQSDKMIITGGGAFNKFLIERIKYHTSLKIVIPEPDIINFKEALIFAFLGVLRWYDQTNCYSSVTGATKDSSCGIIFNC